jgi:gliding motility-associated-like protein
VQAINDTAQITNLTPITINVKGNDFDPENDSFSVVTVISTGAIGSVTLNNDGTVQYVPSPDTCGFVDSFYYVIQDVHGAVDTGFVYVNVVCPIIVVAVNDSVSICKSDIINIPVLANDTVSSGLTLSVTGVSIPVPGNIGAITSIANNVVTFAANGNTGTVHFFYYACDNGEPTKCDTGEVTIVINACPPPVVDTIFDTTYVNTPDTICLGGLVQSTTSWAITSLCQPQNGTAETLSGDTCFVYTPNTGFFGNDTFCIVVCNQFGCDTSSVIITVLDTLIKAVAETCDVDTTVMNTPITLRVLANDIIPQAADTVVTIKSSPADGVAVVNNDKTITFTPNTNFKGEEQFSYQVCAVTGTRQYCDTAYICVTVVDTTLNCFIPNGFSPNGDGVNDNYEIPCNSKYPKAELRIFDRWGVEVWNSDGPYLNNWNGKNKQGIILPDGTYYVIYSYNDGSGKREAKFVVIHR